MSTPSEQIEPVVAALLKGLGMPESEATRAAHEAATAAREAAEVGRQRLPAEAQIPAPLMVGAAEAGKLAAILETEKFDLREVAGADCSGAECGVSCAAGCIVGCAVGGGTTVGFGAAGGTIGGGGTVIAITKAADVVAVRELPIVRYVYSGPGSYSEG